jgi:hypothetical protein
MAEQRKESAAVDLEATENSFSTAIQSASFPCKECRRLILTGARKCTHCNSYQNWRRHLGVSQVTIALLITLISVVTSAAPRIYDWLYAHSDVRTEFRQVYLYYFELFASNPGNRTGRLTAVKLISETSSGPSNELLLQVYGYASVGPGQDVVVAAFVPPEDLSRFLDWPHRNVTKCTLQVRIVNHEEPPKMIDVDCSVDSYRMFCRASEGIAIQLGKVKALTDSTGQGTGRCN